MTIHQNAFFIGERVEWDTVDGAWSAGTGVISSIYISGADLVCYRVERDERDKERRRTEERLPERYVRRVEERTA